MEALLDFVKANPIYAAGAAVLLLFVVMALVKKAVKLAVIAIALNAGYGYYLNELAQDYYEQAQKKLAVAREKAEAAAEQYESAKETVKAAQETVDKAGDLFDQASTLIER